MSAAVGPGGRVGPYEVVRQLGAGGFGRTFEARHVDLGERACLKIGHAEEHDDLLLREGRILWGLHHPSLPTLRDALHLPDGRLVLAMRFVEGQPLDARRPLAADRAVRLLGRALKALRVLHHRGIVHADVKPQNLLVERDAYEVVLVDFGCAAIRPTARTRPIGHTEMFAPPEALAGAPPIPESDLYGLGLSFLHALGGDVAARVLPEGAPKPLLRLLCGLAHKDPRQRPRWSRDDPLEALKRVAQELGLAGGGEASSA